ncbi:hypothetical protein C8R46DRAFT_1221059 [Mycena filopes]|nr:hypothetical protein C8R46DRAFT_1221059 [Mycena filopes]
MPPKNSPEDRRFMQAFNSSQYHERATKRRGRECRRCANESTCYHSKNNKPGKTLAANRLANTAKRTLGDWREMRGKHARRHNASASAQPKRHRAQSSIESGSESTVNEEQKGARSKST